MFPSDLLTFYFYFLGDAQDEAELLTWVLYQMKEDTIENVNRELLFKMIEENEFLAVFFRTKNSSFTFSNPLTVIVILRRHLRLFLRTHSCLPPRDKRRSHPSGVDKNVFILYIFGILSYLKSKVPTSFHPPLCGDV